MSLSSSLNNALSGLTVASRSAELVSANVANAMTEGYGRRALSVTGASVTGEGQGARIIGIDRLVNQAALADLRFAKAGAGASDTMVNFFSQLEAEYGTPDNPNSLSAALAGLESALITSAANPESAEKLARVADAAMHTVQKFNDVSDRIGSLRQDADTQIAKTVSDLNRGLQNLHEINEQVVRFKAAGLDISGLLDERQVELDRLADIVPLREVDQDGGRISVVTQTGATLLSARPAQIEFSPTATIQPHMLVSNALLGELSISGAGSMPGDAAFALKGGSLEALFDLRDVAAVGAQSQLDALAREVVGRFEDPALDPSITPGQPGLFTDQGAAFDPLYEAGLAGRMAINPAIDPASGGTLSALRDGLYAPAGPVGDNSLLNAMLDGLNAIRLPSSGDFATGGSLSSLATSLLSETSQNLLAAEADQSFSSARVFSLSQSVSEDAVNTDEEMQRLLLVEQLYAANAKVIASVDEMLQQILGL